MSDDQERREDPEAPEARGEAGGDAELEALKAEAEAEGPADGEASDAIRAEIRDALDAEDGVPVVDEGEAEQGAEDPPGDEGGESAAEVEERLEHVRQLTGFRRGHVPIMLLLPPLTVYMWICVTFYGGRLVLPTSWEAFRELLGHVPAPTLEGFGILAGWFLLQVLLQAYAPGKIVYGTPLPDGRRLPYKMNGLFSFWTTMGLAVLVVGVGWLPATLLADHFGPMLVIANIGAFVFSAYLYFLGKAKPEGEHVTGKPLYDYFMGTARNPRIGDFDLKLFFEARPGLILWVLLNFSFAAEQLERTGTLTAPMVLVCAFHFLYVADYYFHEKAILSTMDIKHENFGWMLCWGDFPWVPFTYSIQAMYLVQHTHALPWWAIVGIVALNMGGYFLFRSINSQKDRFREEPDREIWGQKPTYIETKRGTLLLTSGFWGMARHMNYMGDLMMALAWCLPCGFGHLLPYFYFIYFTWLLVHREWRDDKMCHAKYGADWEEYRKKVPYRIVPYVY